MQDLLEMHWQEVALNKDKIKLNPHWEAYADLENEDQLRIYTARINGELIGYFVVIIGANLHYKDHIFGLNDVIFLHPDWRQTHTGAKMIEFAEKCLKREGVSVLHINTKVHQPFDGLMDFLGYNVVERVYSKWIGE